MGHTEKLEDMSSPINDISNVTENIAKLNAATRIGGKGTVRRKTKRVSKASSAVDEKRLAAALQKLGISSVPESQRQPFARRTRSSLSTTPRCRPQSPRRASSLAAHQLRLPCQLSLPRPRRKRR